MKVNACCPVLIIGTEQEWKLAQCTVEAASNGLYTATNELCIASLKAKSASGRSHQSWLLFIWTLAFMHALYKHCDCMCLFNMFFKII